MSAERIAIVTGTSSGIGAAVAKELLEHGWQVIGVARRTAKFDSGSYKHLALDLAQVERATATIEREVGTRLAGGAWQRIGLVNNAALATQQRASARGEHLVRRGAAAISRSQYLLQHEGGAAHGGNGGRGRSGGRRRLQLRAGRGR